MRRNAGRFAQACAVVYTLLLAAPGVAGTISFDLHGSWIAGSGFDSGTVTAVVLTDAAGTVKAVADESESAGSSWWLSFGSTPSPVIIAPGDRIGISIDHGAIATYYGVPKISASTRLDTDVTAGRVVPAAGMPLPAAVDIGAFLERLVDPPGRSEEWPSADGVPVAADGAFSHDWGAVDLRRNDELDVTLHQDWGGHTWAVTALEPVTGLIVHQGMNTVEVRGKVARSCALEYATKTGTILGRATLTLTHPGSGYAHFFTPKGSPVTLAAPRRVKLKGSEGYTVKIPTLAGSAATAGGSVAVSGTTLPLTVVEIALMHANNEDPDLAYAKSDAAGAFAAVVASTGNQVELRVRLADGTWILRRIGVGF